MSYSSPPPYSQTQPGYHQPPPQHIQAHYTAAPPATTVIIQTTAAPMCVRVANEPTHLTCPACQAIVRTTVIRQPSMRTHLCALLLCLFVCWPCVCIPYCMDSCQNANHYCPNCNAYIGTYQN